MADISINVRAGDTSGLHAITQQGSHTLWNVVPACKPCNTSKGAGAILSPIQPLLLTIAQPHTRTG
jgi:hypothetical protein